MKYSEVIKYIQSHDKVVKQSLNPNGTAFGFCVEDVIFAYFETGAPIQWRLTLEVTEAQYVELHFPPQIVQARDKPEGHWLTIVRLENFDEELLTQLIDASYASARLQAALSQQS